MDRKESDLKLNIKSVWAHNWPTLAGVFCILYIWASDASAVAHAAPIATNRGLGDYLVVAVCAIVSLAVLIYLLRRKKDLWLRCEFIVPSLCAMLLVTSRFFFDLQSPLFALYMNVILGFATATMLTFSVVDVWNEAANGRAFLVMAAALFAVYAAFFVGIFLAWPLMGDRLGDRISSALLVVFLFAVIVGMSARMRKFDAEETLGEDLRDGAAPDAMRDLGSRLAKEYGLSPREQEVLIFLAQGFSVPYIADKLYISNGTVKTHVARIYRKLGVGKRDELMDRLHS
ncbi:helix-turn-helix transcriptional regulator [Adlercreutzia equolifaciens]|uniref:helix-turn-helix transcriptional regulator n=1 Tax=Adlercreutzia equolifaciens TaxID=446660 RepID=UPI00242D54C0|nr:LuxR C-terminal-related transcriptional regulator [Adlercreutzia equolifaciens]